MCGIAGIFGRGADEQLARRMGAAIAHRGPDASGSVLLRDHAGAPVGALAHARLAIIDLSPGGAQPMWSADGAYCIVFNGEIYNYRALRTELEQAGAGFRSTSDTEVILEGWRRQGPAYLEKLRGMFAIAIWEWASNKAWFARDRFGIKPLYVREHAGQILFGSELRALLAGGAPSVIDQDAVRGYLAYGAVPEPLTMFAGVRALPPGTVTEVKLGPSHAVLGQPRVFATALSPEEGTPRVKDAREGAALVRAALSDSVAHHLEADVPVAVFLSGGIDSTVVAALAAQVAREPLDTFTITFGEQAFDEARFARAAAERFGTRHHEVRITGDDMLESLPAAFAAMDQPSMDGLNTYVVSRAVRADGHKVVLSGLGGDELFAGYPSFQRAARGETLWRAAGPLRSLAQPLASRAGVRAGKAALFMGASSPAFGAYAASRVLFADGAVRALGLDPLPHDDVVQCAPDDCSLLQAVSWYEVAGYMRNTLLRDSDVFSMAHALELRVPFVDSGVARAAMALDDSLKLVPGRSKAALVAATEDLLPRDVWDRPKQGFLMPFERWMRGPLHDRIDALLSNGDAAARVGLRPGAVRGVWDDFLSHRNGISWSRPWALFTLLDWASRHDGALAAAA